MNDPHPRITFNDHALKVLEFDTVLGVIASHADSAEGRMHIMQLNPFGDTDFVRGLLSETDEIIQALRFDDPMPSLSVHDIRELFPLMKIESYNLGIENLSAVADNMETARIISEYFVDRTEKYPAIYGIVSDIARMDDIEGRIRQVISPDLEIADNASHELRSIRRRLARARESLRELVEETLASLPDDTVAERLVTVRNNRFVIPIRDSMKNRVPGAVHDRSQTGKTLFIEPLASIESNNLVLELEMAEQAEIQRILLELSSLVASESENLADNQNILVRMDVIKAKARYGVKADGVIPRIDEDAVIDIRKGRHPILDWKLRKQKDGTSVVPLDMKIGDGWVTVVVTGPNAGGKTVALKTVGLITLMALCGMPVPAGEGTSVCIPRGVFADIGDEQSIENDLSTFSSHMRQIVTVLREAGTGSLVLLDELGGGTNPADGEAIALAVLKKLTFSGALTVATTHHDGLKVFAHETESVINASMEFDNEGLRPTFVFREGIPGSSYAFEIAGRMGMPGDVLESAESLAGGERKSLEGLVAEMEEQLRLTREEYKAIESERRKLSSTREDYERRRDDIAARKDDLLEEALAESKKLLQDVNRRIESSIRDIRETKAAHESIVAAKKEAETLKKKLDGLSTNIRKKRRVERRQPAKNIEKGAQVWVQSLNSSAVVEEVLDDSRKARVRVGRHKASFVVNAEDLFEDSADKGKKQEQIVRVNVHSSGIETTEIDIRGMTFNEAQAPLDQFLEGLHLSGIEFARVIHGKGSGALRKKVFNYLDSHPYVESCRLGNWNEGSYGVTMVTLKK